MSLHLSKMTHCCKLHAAAHMSQVNVVRQLKVSEYDQEIPRSNTEDQHTAL